MRENLNSRPQFINFLGFAHYYLSDLAFVLCQVLFECIYHESVFRLIVCGSLYRWICCVDDYKKAEKAIVATLEEV